MATPASTLRATRVPSAANPSVRPTSRSARRSANTWMSGFSSAAASIAWTMRPTAVSRPTRSTRTSISPYSTRVAANTASPFRRSTGSAARVGIPTAVLATMKRAADEGVLVKGPRTLEALARIDTVVFDKTGTLTSGTPRVARVACYARGLDENALIRLVAAAEHGFQPPLARAIRHLAAERQLRVPDAVAPVAQVGLGVDVNVEGRHVLIG